MSVEYSADCDCPAALWCVDASGRGVMVEALGVASPMLRVRSLGRWPCVCVCVCGMGPFFPDPKINNPILTIRLL
jgi:hypothetical protein